MEKITYLFSLNYNKDHSNNEVIETRAIKRAIKNEENDSDSLQYLKADTRRYSEKVAANQVLDMLDNEAFLAYSDEITHDEFRAYMDESFDLFALDMSQLDLF